MIIRNGNVFQEDGSYRKMDLYVENGRIVSSEEEVSDKEEIDASGLKVLPGLVDIHSHGAVGHDFSDADVDGLKIILQYEKSQGITSYCPTSMTLPKEQLKKIFKGIREAEKSGDGATWRDRSLIRPKKELMWKDISANRILDFSKNVIRQQAD